MFHQKYRPALRIRYSLKNLYYRDGMLNIPLFLSDYTTELIEMVLSGNLIQEKHQNEDK
ncbi:MAG: hypothetical protein BWY27_01213 [Bacteroidetes bacterium ADurb.Bin234]|nr:MAG: hypothetical protein BWY27_01213 [Bacteroidetes bacterium ADurb.Bin234]